MKVAKFGGSSVSNAKQIKKVLKIVNDDPERKIIIVSAPGKRFSDDIKTTDLLIRLYEKVINNIDYQHKKQEIVQRYADIVEELDMERDILTTIDETLEKYIYELKDKPARLYDAIVSCGEDFNAQRIAAYNNSQGIPTKYISPKDAGILVTDLPKQAQILDSAYEQIYKLNNYKEKLIIPGFFGVSKHHFIVTFPRGGSDITGAIIARGVRASLYENFTDVSGIFKANPNIIKNTDRPQDKGTFIVHDREINSKNVISGISCDKDFTVINIKKYLMNRQVGFTRKILGVLEDYNISFDHMPSGIDNISLVMRSDQIRDVESRVLNDIQKYCDVDELSIDHDLAILMIVGEGMNRVIGTASKITHALAESNINLKMINQGASEISMMFGIKLEDAEKAVKATYEFCYHGICIKD